MLARFVMIVVFKVELQAAGISGRLRLPRDLQFFSASFVNQVYLPNCTVKRVTPISVLQLRIAA